jgi:hypothetical protein
MRKSDMDELKETIDELDEWKRSKEIEEAIHKGLTRWAHTICVTATSSMIGIFYWLGSFMYQKWEPLQAAIKAFLAADRGAS